MNGWVRSCSTCMSWGRGRQLGPAPLHQQLTAMGVHLGRMRRPERLVDDEISEHGDETGAGASKGVGDSVVCIEEDLSETLIN